MTGIQSLQLVITADACVQSAAAAATGARAFDFLARDSARYRLLLNRRLRAGEAAKRIGLVRVRPQGDGWRTWIVHVPAQGARRAVIRLITRSSCGIPGLARRRLFWDQQGSDFGRRAIHSPGARLFHFGQGHLVLFHGDLGFLSRRWALPRIHKADGAIRSDALEDLCLCDGGYRCHHRTPTDQHGQECPLHGPPT